MMASGSMINLNAATRSAKVAPDTAGGAGGGAKQYRRVAVNNPVLNAATSNAVRTSKYRWWNFLLKSLFEQFRRLANLYFLVISVLQVATSLSPTSKYSTLIPLVGVLFVTMLKEVYEDYFRHRADSRVNACTARVLRQRGPAAAGTGAAGAHAAGGWEFVSIAWADIKAGDVVALANREAVPADIVLLAAASEQGVTYIETANLDGETNLKLRQSVDATQHFLAHAVPAANPGLPLLTHANSTSTNAAAAGGGGGRSSAAAGSNGSAANLNRNGTASGGAPVSPTAFKPAIFQKPQRTSVAAALENADALAELGAWRAEVECEEPTEDLYEFEGALITHSGRGAEVRVPVSLKNVVWRGATIMNTALVYGVVVFTGQETRLIKNSRAAPSKRSAVDKLVNTSIVIIFVAQALMCTVSTLLYANWLSQQRSANDGDDAMWYLPFLAGQSQGDTATTWVTFFILYNNLVPISLYVSLEFVKLFQAQLINSDRAMYHAPTNTPATARTSNLNEDLGQVQFIFSDKTGTLTCNQMEFHRCSVGGVVYGATVDPNAPHPVSTHATNAPALRLDSVAGSTVGGGGDRHPGMRKPSSVGDSPHLGPSRITGIRASLSVAPHRDSSANGADGGGGGSARPSPNMRPTPSPGLSGMSGLVLGGATGVGTGAAGAFDEKAAQHVPAPRGLVRAPGYNFDDRAFLTALKHPERDPAQARKLREFLTVLAVCHSVMPERDEHSGQILYKASSPDDGALVQAAKQLGFEFVYRDARGLRVRQFGVDTTYEVLNINAFSSDRRCMSVIIRQPDGRIVLYAKGADEVILPNLRADVAGSDEDVTTQNNLSEFASTGLRTLVMGRAELDPARYDDWNTKFQIAAAQINNREQRLAELATEVERDYELIGATAIEDKLQDGVPDTIQKLGDAGIRVWMLTGDKLETAQNIGYSCRLLTPGLDIVRISDAGYAQCASVLASTFTRYKRNVGRISDKLALVVTGRALTFIFARKDLNFLFLQLCKMARVVIACRVIPAQKAEIVRMVRTGVSPEPMTLAIGDGANDVSMIQEAHVGVGISGNEGMQAVRAADYALAQFAYLERLLLVHGRWNYMRVCFLILYSFYKNIAYVFTLFYYGFSNGFSGTTLYESYLGSAWNIAFTLVPVLLYGILEQDVSANTALKNPFAYMPKVGDGFNYARMGQWALNAIAHSILIYALCFGAFEELPVMFGSVGGGADPGLFALGTVVNFCAVLTVTAKIALETRFWTRRGVAGVVFSIAIWFVFVLAYSSMSVKLSWDYWGIGVQVLAWPMFWLLTLLVPTTAMLLDLIVAHVSTAYYPTIVQVVRERESLRRKAMALARGTGAAAGGHARMSSGNDEEAGATAQNERDESANEDDAGVEIGPIGRRENSVSGGGDGGSPRRRRGQRNSDAAAAAAAAEKHGTELGVTPFSHSPHTPAPVGEGGEAVHKPAELIKKLVHLSNVLQGKYVPRTDFVALASPRGNRSPNINVPQPVTRSPRHAAAGAGAGHDDDDADDPNVDVEDRKQTKAGSGGVGATAAGAAADGAAPKGDAAANASSPHKEVVQMHWLTLRFVNHPELEAEYQNMFVLKSIRFMRTAMTLIFAFLVGYAIISAASRQSDWLLRVIVTTVGGLVLGVIWTSLFVKYYVQIVSVILCAIAVLRSVLITGDGVLSMGLLAIIVFLVMRSRFIHAMCIVALDVVVYLVWMLARGSSSGLSPWQVTQIVLLHLLGVCTFCAYVCWSWETTFRRDFLLQKDYEMEQEHTQSILNNMLPLYIIKRIKRQTAAREEHLKSLSSALKQQKLIPVSARGDHGDRSARGSQPAAAGAAAFRRPGDANGRGSLMESTTVNGGGGGGGAQPSPLARRNSSDRSLQAIRRTLSSIKPEEMSPLLRNLKDLSEQGIVIADEEKSVSILFCDMMDFSRFVATHTPGTVVAILDAVYSTFDELCMKYGVQKMETVGKTYMACAGLHGTRKDHAHAVAEMAEEMIALMRKCVDKNGLPLEVRIGIHTGKVLSGVVGLKRPQYSLFGDTVNTSSRIQSTGEAGKIHLSAETYAHLKKDYRCTKRKVQAKGKGWLTTYFLGERVTRVPMNRKIAYKEDQDNITNEEIQKLVKNADPFALHDIDPYVSADGQHAVNTHPLLLRFGEAEDEREYRRENQRLTGVWSRRPLWIACVYWALEAIFFYFNGDESGKSAAVDFGVRYAFVAVCLALIKASTTRHYVKHAATYLTIVFSLGLLADLSVPLSLGDQVLDHRAVMSYIFLVTLVSNSGVLMFPANLGYNIASFLLFVVATHVIAKRTAVFTNGEALQMDFFVLAGAIINLIASYGRETYMRREFVLTHRVRMEKDKAEAFLYQMLPRQVAQDVKRGVSGIASKFENVTILYSDIKGFTKFSASSTPEAVVQLLSKLFSQFDLLTDKLRVYKVQTIGDAYVLVGGFTFQEFPPGHPKPTPEDHADYVVQMGYEMHRVIKAVRTVNDGSIEMRIGIHTGEVIAGIIGTKQLRYDIWGTDCLVANTMESNGVPSGIVVSGSTARLIRNRYELIEGPVVNIKGKGKVEMFAVRCPIGRPEMTLQTQFPIEEHSAPAATPNPHAHDTPGTAASSPALGGGAAMDEKPDEPDVPGLPGMSVGPTGSYRPPPPRSMEGVVLGGGGAALAGRGAGSGERKHHDP